MTANLQANNLAIKPINESTGSKVQVDDNIIHLDMTTFPKDETVERTVIGHVLATTLMSTEEGTSLFKQLQPFVRADDFYYLKHSLIFKAMEKIVARGEQIDLLAIQSALKEHQGKTMTALEYVGGEQALLGMTHVVPQNTLTHAKQIVRLSLARNIIMTGRYLATVGQDPSIGIDTTLASMTKFNNQMTARASAISDRKSYNLADILDDYTQSIIDDSNDATYSSGIQIWVPELDDALMGWRPYKMYIVAAGTGMGKSAFMFSAALEALKEGKRVVFFTLEMRYNELMDRLMSIVSGIDGRTVSKRNLSPAEQERLREASNRVAAYLAKGKLTIEELAMPTMDTLRGRIDEHVQLGADIAFIDYLGIEMVQFASDSGRRKDPSPVEHANQIWTKARQLKMDYPIPIVVGAQVNRNYLSRDSKRPERTDIAYSSLAEFAADAVLLLHRMSVVDTMAKQEHADITIAKNRSGPGGASDRIDLKFNASTTYFSRWHK